MPAPITEASTFSRIRPLSLSTDNSATQYNPIGACMWFVTNSYYEDNSRTYNGQEQYTFNGGSTWKNIVEKNVIGSHTFFRVTGY